MVVNAGNKALASDFNTLADLVDEWFSDGCSSCVFGDPTQTLGWGGSAIVDVVQGDDMLATQINAITDRLNIGVDITTITGNMAQVSGDILAIDYNQREILEGTVRFNRTDIDLAETSIIAGTTDARTTVWPGTINNTIRYTFSGFNNARYFFNSGGAIQLSLALVGGTTGAAINWTTLFSTMGTITFNFEETTQSGGGGTPTPNLGYYDLTTGFQQIFTQSGGGAYSDNEIIINARRQATGTYVEIQIVLNDDHAGSVDGTTTATFTSRKLDNQSSGAATLTIATPVVSVTDTFE